MKINLQICHILKNKNLSKREFAKEFEKRGVKLDSTGEIPSEKAIYAYLSGANAIKADLIPDICEILNITEQELFDDSESKRLKILKWILKNPTEQEKQTAYLLLEKDKPVNFPHDYQMKRIAELLDYAPPLAIEQIIKTLEQYKKLFEEL